MVIYNIAKKGLKMTFHSNYTTETFFNIKRLPWKSFLMTKNEVFDNRDTKDQLIPITLWLGVGRHFMGE